MKVLTGLVVACLISFPVMAKPLPKVIHTCAIGVDKKDVKSAVKNWSEKMPRYNIRVWDEKTFNLDVPPQQRTLPEYIYRAYQDKKYDAVNAYCSFKVLNDEGGIYLDPYQQLNRSVETRIHDDLVLVFMHDKLLTTTIMGMPAKHILAQQMLKYYDHHQDVFGNIPADYLLTDMVFQQYQLIHQNGKRQVKSGEIILWPANEYMINLGDSENRSQYRFDLAKNKRKQFGMDPESLKTSFLKNHAIVVKYKNETVHMYHLYGNIHYFYEKQKATPFAYLDNDMAIINWDGPTLHFELKDGIYEFERIYQLAGKSHYGKTAKELETQGNDIPTENKGKKK